VIPQNGHQLLTTNGESTGSADADYITAIDGVGREDLFYGYDNDNEATPADVTEEFVDFMDVAVDNGVTVLAIDYCSDHDKMDDSYAQSEARGYISFAADERNLNNIPDYPATPYNENAEDITTLAEAKNFLYLLNTDLYATENDFFEALAQTNFDVIVMDAFFAGGSDIYEAADIEALKTKANGGQRLVISYMSIGEAEDYRYYWEADWLTDSPSWLDEENPDWEGNYKVRYWDEDWQAIIFGGDDAYLDKILTASFDGVYLDIIDAFEYFEE
jgi:cysteinyl-tRNA synthetase